MSKWPIAPKVKWLPSRREFLRELKTMAKLGLLSSSGLLFLSRCSGSDPGQEDLDVPLICDGSCNTNGSTAHSTSTGAGPTYLVFSGYNPESGFVGYNVWYGTASNIATGHASGNRNLVINSTGSSIIDASSTGGTSLPSYSTSATVNQTTFIELQINNTISGNYLYVTAYNSTDNIESSLSNGFLIP